MNYFCHINNVPDGFKYLTNRKVQDRKKILLACGGIKKLSPVKYLPLLPILFIFSNF